MTGETRKERTSKEATPGAQTLSVNPPPPPRVKPVAVPVAAPRPIFLNSSGLLSDELLANINQKWEACWPINMLKPLVLLDLISYLLFIRELKERRLLTGKAGEISGNLIHAKELAELSWNGFKDMDAQSMHALFTKEKGLPDLIKSYGRTNRQYSLFVKEPLLLTPTSAMLANMMGIIKIMEAEDKNTRAAIFEYLINKAEITGQNGQVYAPDYVVRLVVAMMQPSPEDVIGDPSAGNGSFLVNSAMYIAHKNAAAIPNFKTDFASNMYKGIESDLIQLRIGAMNMILHGIDHPKLESLNVFSNINISIREQPTLILSNLFFEGVEDKAPAGTSTSKTNTRRHEIRFLNFILKSLKTGGRCAVILRDNILYDIATEIKTIRQQIIDNNKLEAVISLPVKAGSLFSGACILIFTKTGTNITDKVWFYKMETKKREINTGNSDKSNPVKSNILPCIEGYDDMADLMARWKNEKEETGKKRTDKSFYVPADEIRTNNYNLNFNEYRKAVKEPEIYSYKEPQVAHTEPLPVNINSSEKTPYLKKSLPLPKAVSVKKRFSTVFVLLFVAVLGLVSYFIFFKGGSNNKNVTVAPINNNATEGKINPTETTDQSTSKNSLAAKKLSSKQIKDILKDTTGFIRFQKATAGVPGNIKDRRTVPGNSSATVLPGKKSQPVESGRMLKVQYTVVDTTYFHDKPDERTRRRSYLDPLNKNILKPIDDENGFIYIVYTNRFGRTSKGWINKKDLRVLR